MALLDGATVGMFDAIDGAGWLSCCAIGGGVTLAGAGGFVLGGCGSGNGELMLTESG